MKTQLLNRPMIRAHWLKSAASIGLTLLFQAPASQAQIAIQDGSPLSMTHPTEPSNAEQGFHRLAPTDAIESEGKRSFYRIRVTR